MPRTSVFEKYPIKNSRHKQPHDLDLRTEFASRSRAQLVIRCLGFRSFWQLAEVAGIGHETCAHMLYKPGRLAYRSSFDLLFSALRDAFQKQKSRMTTKEKEFLKEFMVDWAKTAVTDGMMRERISQRVPDKQLDTRSLNQRHRRQKRRLEDVLRMIEGF